MHIKSSNVFGTRNEVKPTKDLIVVVGANYIGFSQSLLDNLQKGTELINLSTEKYVPYSKGHCGLEKLKELLNSGDYCVTYFIHTGSTAEGPVREEAEASLSLIRTLAKSCPEIIKNMIIFDCAELWHNSSTLFATTRTPEGDTSYGEDIKQAKKDGLRITHLFMYNSARINTPEGYKEKCFSLAINHFKKPEVRNLSLLVGPYGEQELVGDGEAMPYIGE